MSTKFNNSSAKNKLDTFYLLKRRIARFEQEIKLNAPDIIKKYEILLIKSACNDYLKFLQK